MNLSLGAGQSKQEGFVSIDWNPLTHPDVLHDLTKFPYPFPDNSFDCAEAFHILEHLPNVFDTMKELHRILKPGGALHIKVPHFSRGFTHAEHKAGFDITFPLYFDKTFTTSGFFGVEFKLEKMELRWLAHAELIRCGKGTLAILRMIDKVLSCLANKNQALCSRIWCFWVGGFQEIEFIFKKI